MSQQGRLNADNELMARRKFRVIEGGRGARQPHRVGLPSRGPIRPGSTPLPLDPHALDPLTAVAFFDHMAKTWRSPERSPSLRIVRDY